MKKPAGKGLNWSDRLVLALVGAYVVIYGYGQILRGTPIYTNWRGSDVSAEFVIFLGALLLLVAIFPWRRIHFLWDPKRKKLRHMTLDEARDLVIEGINYAAYHETDFSLHDSDKNRLFGSQYYDSGRPVYEQSPSAEGDFEAKMATLLVWANVLNRAVPAFREAQKLLEGEDSPVGRVIRCAKTRKTLDIAPEIKFGRSST
jgi:hypothetical protein